MGELEQLILLAVIRLGDDAYGVRIREMIRERTGREVSAGIDPSTALRQD